MTDRLSLTTAEIEYVLSVADPDGTSPARRLLARLGVAPGGEAVDDPAATQPSQDLLDAGAGSLALRGYIIPGTPITLSPAVSAVAQALAHPRAAVEIGLVADDAADGALFIDAGVNRLVVAPRAFRCFEITSLETSDPLASQLGNIAEAFLAQHQPGVAAVVAHTWPARARRHIHAGGDRDLPGRRVELRAGRRQ